jgi:hypothetical protein
VINRARKPANARNPKPVVRQFDEAKLFYARAIAVEGVPATTRELARLALKGTEAATRRRFAEAGFSPVICQGLELNKRIFERAAGDANAGNVGHGRLRSWFLTTQFWHSMPGGRPPQQVRSPYNNVTRGIDSTTYGLLAHQRV